MAIYRPRLEYLPAVDISQHGAARGGGGGGRTVPLILKWLERDVPTARGACNNMISSCLAPSSSSSSSCTLVTVLPSHLAISKVPEKHGYCNTIAQPAGMKKIKIKRGKERKKIPVLIFSGGRRHLYRSLRKLGRVSYSLLPSREQWVTNVPASVFLFLLSGPMHAFNNYRTSSLWKDGGTHFRRME